MSEFAHRYAEERTQPIAPARAAGRRAASALTNSARGRLLLVMPVLAVIWAGVYWALA